MIKQKLKSAWGWCRRQWKKFLVFLGISVVVVLAAGAPSVPAEYVNAPENNTFKIGVMNYQSEYADDISQAGSLKYKLDDKYISFTPVSFGWKNREIPIAQVVKLADSPKWENVFGEGIDIEVLEGQRTWRKVLKVDVPDIVGLIPDSIDHIDIIYEVDTNFVIDGWNRKDEFEITDTTRLGDYSYLEPAYAWDSFSTTTCEMQELCEDKCDPECVSDLDGCDVCECETQEVCTTTDHKIQIRSYFLEDKGKLYYTKEVPTDWIKTALFPVYTDADVTYGTATNLAETSSLWIVIDELDTDKFVACYADVTDGYSGQCRVGTVSDTTITWGSVSEFNGDISCVGREFAVCKLDTDKFVVAYSDDVLLDDGYARAVTVSTRTIGSWGTAKEFETDDAEVLSCVGLDTSTDKFVIVYNDETNSDSISSDVCTVSGTTITCGTVVPWSNGSYRADFTKVDAKNTNEFVAGASVYESGQNDSQYIAGTVSGTTITHGSMAAGPPVVDHDLPMDIRALDTDKFVSAFSIYSGYGITYAGTISGTTITLGDAYNVTTTAAEAMPAIVKIDTTNFIKTSSWGFPSEKGISHKMTVDFSDRTFTHNAAETYTNNPIKTDSHDAVTISSNKIAICYTIDDANDYAYCIIGDIAGAAPPPAAPAAGGGVIMF